MTEQSLISGEGAEGRQDTVREEMEIGGRSWGPLGGGEECMCSAGPLLESRGV